MHRPFHGTAATVGRCVVACAALVASARAAAADGRPIAPAWRTYACAEALIMGRDGESGRPLVVDGLSGDTLLAGQDLGFPFGGEG